MINAYIGLGSNLGNRLAFIRGGRDALLSRPEISLVKASGVYETVPEGGAADNPMFLNAVLEIQTWLSPPELLNVCLAVEDEFGRTRPERWAPRTLDVDILLYDNQVINEPNLVIPHPRLHKRAFVLAPMREIAPEILHPQMRLSMNELAENLSDVAFLKPIRNSW